MVVYSVLRRSLSEQRVVLFAGAHLLRHFLFSTGIRLPKLHFTASTYGLICFGCLDCDISYFIYGYEEGIETLYARSKGRCSIESVVEKNEAVEALCGANEGNKQF